MPASLNQRISISALIIVLIFISITATALNQAFVKSSTQALQQTLSSYTLALMGSTEVNFNQNKLNLTTTSDGLIKLLNLPNSGLYAQVINAQNTVLWQSKSYVNSVVPKVAFIGAGKEAFRQINEKNLSFLQYRFGVSWLVGDKAIPLTFSVTQNLSDFQKELATFRNTLWFWLLFLAFTLVITQLIVLRWGLAPMHQVGQEIVHIKLGKQHTITGQYPKEISLISDQVNQLLEHEQQQQKRYKNALGDLAHSLKTPLAILQSEIKPQQQILQEPLQRINQLVDYQLQKAATQGNVYLAQQIDVISLTQRICSSLEKVYIDKAIKLIKHFPAKLSYKIDDGDYMELLGNVLDNAFKWAQSTITISILQKQNKLSIVIEDDGVGFPPNKLEELLQRGKRADESISGQGIGLNIVHNIIDQYQGTISISRVDSRTSVQLIL